MRRLFLIFATTLLFGGCHFFFNSSKVSPNEIISTAEWDLKGVANPARHVVALVFNRKGELLMSHVAREDGMNVAFGTETISAGENALPWETFTKLMENEGISFLQLQYVLAADTSQAGEPMFDMIATGKWHGEQGRQYGEVYWHLLNEREISSALTQPNAKPTVMYALQWAAAFAMRQGDESPLQTGVRAARNQLGAPADQLRPEYYWYNQETETGYLRLRYTGSAKDVFIISDPERGTKRNYRYEMQWRARRHASVRLLREYLRLVEHVPVEQEVRLFR